MLFKDTHNYPIDGKIISQIFREEFTSNKNIRYDSKTFDFNGFNRRTITHVKTIGAYDLMKVRNIAEIWKNRRFPNVLKENKQILFDYLELCKKHNVTPILIFYPAISIYREFYSKYMIDELYSIIEEAKQRYSFHFLDNFNSDSMLNWQDFSDGDHLNQSGATKFSKYINDYIMQLEKDI